MTCQTRSPEGVLKNRRADRRCATAASEIRGSKARREAADSGRSPGVFLLDTDGNSVEAVYHGRLRRGPNVIDHLWIRVADVASARAFYETVAPSLGHRVRDGRAGRVHVETDDRSFTLLSGTPTANLHMAFVAVDDAAVAEFHRAAVAAGYRDNGPPGERPEYHPGYYAAFVLDPSGTNVEAVRHNRP